MTTIIITPSGESTGSNAFGLLTAILVLIVLGALFVIYALPKLRNVDAPKSNSLEINMTTPTSNTSAPSAEGSQ
jgi:hypothetical protein